MKYFRHSPLVFWLLALFVLGGLVGGALWSGAHSAAAPVPHARQLTGTDHQAIRTLRTDLGRMDLALGSGASLTAWTRHVTTTATAAATARTRTAGDDVVARDFALVAEAAQQVAWMPTAAPTAARWQAATAVGASIDQLTFDSGAIR